jgi:hypothetical protein
MKRFFGLAMLFPSILSSASAVYLTDPAKLPSTTFDYIVVGGKLALRCPSQDAHADSASQAERLATSWPAVCLRTTSTPCSCLKLGLIRPTT